MRALALVSATLTCRSARTNIDIQDLCRKGVYEGKLGEVAFNSWSYLTESFFGCPSGTGSF